MSNMEEDFPAIARVARYRYQDDLLPHSRSQRTSKLSAEASQCRDPQLCVRPANHGAMDVRAEKRQGVQANE